MYKYFETINEIVETGHWITDSISQELREYDIYEPQYNVLRILRSAGGKALKVNEILAQMVQRTSNVSRIIDKLVAKKLVARNLSKTDRRKMNVVLTPQGYELLKKLDVKVQRFHQPQMKNLTDLEIATLKNLLKKLRK